MLIRVSARIMDLQYTTLFSFLLIIYNHQLSQASSSTPAYAPEMIMALDNIPSQLESAKLPCTPTTGRDGLERTLYCPSLQQIDVQIIVNPERGVDVVCLAKNIDISEINLDVGETIGFTSTKCNLVDRFQQIFTQWNIRNAEHWYVQNFSDKDFVLQRREFSGMNVSLVKSIGIHYSNIIGIEPDTFRDFVNLDIISLKWNKIANLPDFSNCNYLRVIDLGSNRLANLPDHLDVPSLHSLLLWTNNITNISESFFANTTKLKTVELKTNQIKSLPEKLLNPLVELLEIGLSENDFTEIPSNFFKMNKALDRITLSSLDIAEIPENVFAGLSNLQTIMLHSTLLETLPENLFGDQSKLRTLYLGYNRLTSLPKGIFRNLEKLESLELPNNLLSEWNGLPKNLHNLTNLDLSGNKFVRIASDFSVNMRNLKMLSLRKNSIFDISPSAFNGLELRVLDLSHNNLTDSDAVVSFIGEIARVDKLILAYNFYESVLDGFEPKTRILDLSFNKIKNISLATMINLEQGIFNDNQIDTINFDSIRAVLVAFSSEIDHHKTNLLIDNNPINCNCDAFPLIEYYEDIHSERDINKRISLSKKVECSAPSKFAGIPVKNLKSESFSCDYNTLYRCPDVCSCEMYPKYQSLNVSCADRNLHEPPDIPTFRSTRYGGDFVPIFVIEKLVVDLRNNSIANFTEEDFSYVNVSELYLSDNELVTVDWLPPRLEVVELDTNRLENVGYEAILALNNSKRLKRLTLHDNRWNCNCKLLNLTRLIKWENWKIPFEDRILCSDGEKVVSLVEGNLCGFENQAALIAIGICFFLFLIMIGVALILYYKYEYHVRVWLYSQPLFMRFVTEEDLDKDKVYDAFLCYSHEDEKFVEKELVPQLETGPNPYELCIHIRDFIVGEFIAKQIVDSVEKSRRTIIVLSPHFLKSEWALMEFRTAHNQAMRESRQRLIVILYGDFDLNAIEDEDLRTYLSTNTYVKWGDPWFWKKLKYVLPHKKNEHNNNDVRNSPRKLKNKKMENIMVTIDKMDLINSPATPNLGTPPAVSLDPLLLKGNALNFKTASNTETPPAEAGLITTVNS